MAVDVSMREQKWQWVGSTLNKGASHPAIEWVALKLAVLNRRGKVQASPKNMGIEAPC